MTTMVVRKTRFFIVQPLGVGNKKTWMFLIDTHMLDENAAVTFPGDA